MYEISSALSSDLFPLVYTSIYIYIYMYIRLSATFQRNVNVPEDLKTELHLIMVNGSMKVLRFSEIPDLDIFVSYIE